MESPHGLGVGYDNRLGNPWDKPQVCRCILHPAFASVPDLPSASTRKQAREPSVSRVPEPAWSRRRRGEGISEDKTRRLPGLARIPRTLLGSILQRRRAVLI